MLVACGMLAWIFACVVVVSLCVMAARGDGRPMRGDAGSPSPVCTTYVVVS